MLFCLRTLMLWLTIDGLDPASNRLILLGGVPIVIPIPFYGSYILAPAPLSEGFAPFD